MLDLFDAIAHPQRRAVLRLVIDGELPAGELARRTGMRQPTASQHLKVLRNAGLVEVRALGTQRLYRASPEGLERLRAELDALWRPSLEAFRAAAEAEVQP
ncbi:MAG: ArsR family transcriptional regulator [Dehalococcoidia bacterium]|nr:ArsR family transcriptional regulator [Dehalococcoidia bacterium]